MSFGDSVTFGDISARKFGDVLKRLLKEKRFYEKSKFGALSEAWREVVGDEIAARTKIVSYQHGYLRVEVDSSILMQELSGFMEHTILQELQQTTGGEDVAGIRFCLGSEND
jgi:predicted nucleic acid-binding Zn ribbon protein